MFWMLFALTGCEHGLTLPPDDGGGYSGPLKPNLKLNVRPRRRLLPGSDSSPPPPEPAIYASQCADLEDGGIIAGPDCATAEISCGDTVIGHTIGGVEKYDTRFYERNFCTPALTNHDGGDERVYKLTLPPGDHKAFVTLDTPCADLDIAAMKITQDTCPAEGSIIHQCEMYPKSGTSREKLELVSQKHSVWWIVVEGKPGEEGPFALHVQCREGLI